jgi:uncharacterized membrane protein SpoIIM required for sporulation
VSGVPLRSARFRREREARWRELARIVGKVEKSGLGELSQREVGRLPALYRHALASFSVARAISLDRNLLDFLRSLAARGFFAVYGTRHRVFVSLAAFFGAAFPRAVRRYLPHLALAWLGLLLGTAIGYEVTRHDPERYFSFVDAAYAQGRNPSSTAAELRKVLEARTDGFGSGLALFASFLFSHNARIGMLCFALGIVFGVPTVVLLLMNGMILGAMTALHVSKGLGAEWWLWVLPHGVTELSAVCLCGAGGLALGQALLFPGERTRRDALAEHGRRAAALVGGAIAMLFLAGLIEGIFRQTVADATARGAMAAATAALWIAYFALAGRRR